MFYRKVKEFRQQLLIYLDVIEVSFTHNWGRFSKIYLEVIDGYILIHSPARKILLRVAQMLNWRILVESLVRRGTLQVEIESPARRKKT